MSLPEEGIEKFLLAPKEDAGQTSLSVFDEELTSKDKSLNLKKDADVDGVNGKYADKIIVRPNNLMPQGIELLFPGRKIEKSSNHIVKCKIFSRNSKNDKKGKATDNKYKTNVGKDIKLCHNSVFTINTKRTRNFPDSLCESVKQKPFLPSTNNANPEKLVKSFESGCINSTVNNNLSPRPLSNKSSSNFLVDNDFMNRSHVEEPLLQKIPSNEHVKTCSINLNNLTKSEVLLKNDYAKLPVYKPKNPLVITISKKYIPLRRIELPSFIPSDEFLMPEDGKAKELLDEALSSGLTENLDEVDYNANSLLRHGDQIEINPPLHNECLGISHPGFNTLLPLTNTLGSFHSVSSEENIDIKHHSSQYNLESNKIPDKKNEFSNLLRSNEKVQVSVQKTKPTECSTLFRKERNSSVSAKGEQGSIENKIYSNFNNSTYLQSDSFPYHPYLNKININGILKKKHYNKGCEYPNLINLSMDLIVNSENDIPIANEVTVECTADMNIPESKNDNISDNLGTCDDTVKKIKNKNCDISDTYSPNFQDGVNKTKKVTYNENENFKLSNPGNKNYYYNHASPLSFLVQNVLENVFKHESHPSSSNMARLARLLNVHWKDVKDWFFSKRVYYKKIGYSLRNKCLLSCDYCSIVQSPDRPLVHLLSRNHIENIVKNLPLDCPQFAKTPKSNDNVILYNMASSTSIEEYKVAPKYKLPTMKLASISSKLSTEFNSKLKNEIITNKEKLKNFKKSLHENYVTEDVAINDCTLTNISQKISDEKMSTIESINQNLPLNSKSKAIEVKGWLCHNLRSEDNQNYVCFRCPICNVIFENEWMLIKHSLSHRKFICGDCEEVFETEHLLKCHLQQHIIESMTTNSIPMFICNQCMMLDCKCSLPILTTGAKRSKPLATPSYTGVNDHLKVTFEELMEEIDLKSNKYKSVFNVDSSANKNSLVENENSFLPNTYTNFITFNCHKCESFFFNNYELEEHLTLKHFQEITKIKTSDEGMQKFSQSLNLSFFCSYCYVCYKNEYQLRRHLRFNCTKAPKKLTKLLYSYNLFELNENGKGQHYYSLQKTLNVDQNKALSDNIANYCVICNICKLNVDKEKLNLHLSFCMCRNKTPNIVRNVAVKSKKKHRQNKLSKKCFQTKLCNKINEINNIYEENCIYVCCYCEVPFYAIPSLHSHLKIKCQERTKIINSFKFWEGSDYKRIDKDKIMKYYEGNNNIRIKQLLNFKPSEIHKRVICKFCDKTPYKKQVLVHLEKFCANLPKEIKHLLKVKQSFIKSYLDSTESNIIKDCSLNLNFENNCSSRDSDKRMSFVYDCHLCDEQFATSNNFRNHLFEKHNLNVEDNSVIKWLSQRRPNEFIDNKTEELILLDHDIILDNIVDMMHVTDNILEPQFDNVEVSNVLQNSEINTNIEPSHFINDKVAFTESQEAFKLPQFDAKNEFKCEEFKIGEEDDLLEDVDNLESFVETIQLNDTNFEKC